MLPHAAAPSRSRHSGRGPDVALVVIALRYLRTPRNGLTGAANDETTPLFNLQSLVVARYSIAGQAPAAGFEFGGGDSGSRATERF